MALPVGQIPGGPELLIILLVLVLLFGGSAVVLVVVLGGLKLLRGDDRDDDRIADIERELEETRAELRSLREGVATEGAQTADASEPGGGVEADADGGADEDTDDPDYEASRSA